MKCLEKDRARRYETANGLAADLKRNLNHEPVVARPPSNAYRFQKAFRRNRLAFAAGAPVAAALGIGAMVASWQAVRATRARNEASTAQEREATQRRAPKRRNGRRKPAPGRPPRPTRPGPNDAGRYPGRRNAPPPGCFSTAARRPARGMPQVPETCSRPARGRCGKLRTTGLGAGRSAAGTVGRCPGGAGARRILRCRAFPPRPGRTACAG